MSLPILLTSYRLQQRIQEGIKGRQNVNRESSRITFAVNTEVNSLAAVDPVAYFALHLDSGYAHSATSSIRASFINAADFWTKDRTRPEGGR